MIAHRRLFLYIGFSLACCTSSANAQNLDTSHYPYHVPEWLWQDSRRSSIVASNLRREIQEDLKVLQTLQGADASPEADRKEIEIANKLSQAVALHNLVSNAVLVTNASSGVQLALQIDPAFDSMAQKTLQAGAELFLRCALDEKVIGTALEQSTIAPQPMPVMYQMHDGMPVLDEFGNKTFTKEYKFYLNSRARPANATAFKGELRHALSEGNGEPALLIISRYYGDAWWGRSWYGYFYAPEQQLVRESPPQGYFYIALNSDKLKPDVPGWNDPPFWASKIAHEMLHSLNYWHPNYKDPAERDANNQGNAKAFIVAYELGVFAKSAQISRGQK